MENDGSLANLRHVSYLAPPMCSCCDVYVASSPGKGLARVAVDSLHNGLGRWDKSSCSEGEKQLIQHPRNALACHVLADANLVGPGGVGMRRKQPDLACK